MARTVRLASDAARFRASVSEPPVPGAPDRSLSEPGSSTALLEKEETTDDASDADRYTHYVRKDKLAKSAATGRPVVALCGKIWTPRRDPSKYPVCPECKEIYSKLRGE